MKLLNIEGYLQLQTVTHSLNIFFDQIRTTRRIVLTGTPLQNNLMEYYVMVNFVKPHLLGTKREFVNLFVNPIENGQHSNSTEHDVCLMKERVFVLHQLLNQCIHRRDYHVLEQSLVPKLEYVLSVRLTEVQAKLYQRYLDICLKQMEKNQFLKENRMHNGPGCRLLSDYVILRLVWSHPFLVLRSSQIEENDQIRKQRQVSFVNI